MCLRFNGQQQVAHSPTEDECRIDRGIIFGVLLLRSSTNPNDGVTSCGPTRKRLKRLCHSDIFLPPKTWI